MAYEFPNSVPCTSCGSMVTVAELATLRAELDAVVKERDHNLLVGGDITCLEIDKPGCGVCTLCLGAARDKLNEVYTATANEAHTQSLAIDELTADLATARAANAQMEAQAGAMCEALSNLAGAANEVYIRDDAFTVECDGDGRRNRDDALGEAIDGAVKALAPGAGQALLDRLQAAEAVNALLFNHHKVYDGLVMSDGFMHQACGASCTACDLLDALRAREGA